VTNLSLLPVPARDVIDAAVAALDASRVDIDDAVGECLADAATLIVHRGPGSGCGARCGIWTVDQRLVGYVEEGEHSYVRAGLIADTDGRVLGERRAVHRRDIQRAARDHPELTVWAAESSLCWVTAEDRVLATLRYTWPRELVEFPPPTRTWSLTISRPQCSITDGAVTIAVGRAMKHSKLPGFWGWLRGERALTTALTLQADLDLDQRVVAMLAILEYIGPPKCENDD